MKAPSGNPKPHSRGLDVGLWLAQMLVALSLLAGACMKLFMPIARLAAMMPWMGQVPEWFMRGTGAIDLAGGLGIILPSLTRIKPGLTAAAAIGCALLMACAIVFHVSRGEAMATPFNFLVLGLSVFVLWGRWPRRPRSAPATPE